MKAKLSIMTLALLFLFSFTALAAEQQVFSETMAARGTTSNFYWNWSGDNSVVPKYQKLIISTATFSYIPEDGGAFAVIGLTGRDVNNNAVWRTQMVFVEANKTVHLTFPAGLELKTGGYVEYAFFQGDNGNVFVSLNGRLK